MDFKDYRIADCTKVYYYAPTKQDIINGIEYQATNKKELEQQMKAGNVYSYREEVNRWYFSNKEGEKVV